MNTFDLRTARRRRRSDSKSSPIYINGTARKYKSARRPRPPRLFHAVAKQIERYTHVLGKKTQKYENIEIEDAAQVEYIFRGDLMLPAVRFTST